MAEFGTVTVDDDKLPRQPFYDLELRVLRRDGSYGVEQTRTPFLPTEGMRITVRRRVRETTEWQNRWVEETVTYRVVGQPGLFIDDTAEGEPEVSIECDVKEETT